MISPAGLALEPEERSELFWFLSDTCQLVRRSLLHIRHDPEQLVGVTVQPVMIVLLFRYFLGGAIHLGNGESYINFLMAGAFIETAVLSALTTATGVAADMTRGVVDRFRSLPMHKSAVLSGHVVADLVRSSLGILVMILVGLAVGFRPSAGFSGWVAVIGITLAVTFSMSWVSAVIGLVGGSVEVVQQLGMVLFLPILASSAFVPTSTFPGPLRALSDVTPFTQAIDAIRALLFHRNPGDHVWLAAAWLVGLCGSSFALANYLFGRRTAG